MKNVIKELYSLNKEQLNDLRKRFSDRALLSARNHFMIGKMSSPIHLIHIFYYIDNEGDFLEKGKKLHHKIARAIHASLPVSQQVQVLGYIAANY